MKVFDVFLSYRRTDLLTAEKLYNKLTRDGYHVFWDKESLDFGKFDQSIKTAIRNCKNFILIVNDNTLDRRIESEEDWILQEISEALSFKKNIVPLFIGKSNAFPSNLPDSINAVETYNGISHFDISDEACLEILYKRFLQDRAVYSQDEDFEINGDTLVKCLHETLIMTIPSRIRAIGANAFRNCTRIREVRFNDCLEEIGEGAFDRCNNLEFIDLPPRLRIIRKKAFYRCQHLKSVNLSLSIEVIEEQAFAFCTGIKWMKMDKKLMYIAPDAVEECHSLTSISVEKTNTVYSSKDGVLYDKDFSALLLCPCGRKGVFFIPDTVKTIGPYAFSCSKLNKLIFYNPINSIDKYAFLNSGIKEIDYPFTNEDVVVDRLSFIGSDLLESNPFATGKSKNEEEDTYVKERLVLYEYVIIKTSFESEEEAYNMVKMLLERNLIVSGQIKEHRAIYKWAGAINDEKEIELLCFTRGILYNDVEKFIVSHHSYDCPEILCIPIINTTTPFGKWIDEGTKYGGNQ